jgi:arylsulfatase A-like enzyme
MTRRRILFFSMIAVCLAAVFFRCSRQTTDPFPVTRDILREIKAGVQDETSEIDFHQKEALMKYLLTGWTTVNGGPVHTQGEDSRLVFYHLNESRNLRAAVTWRDMAEGRADETFPAIELNGQSVGSFPVGSASTTVDLTFPAKAVKQGQNVLGIRQRVSKGPATAPRPLVVERIAFERPSPIGKQGLAQPAATAVSYFIELPDQFALDIDCQCFNGVHPSFELADEKGGTVTIGLPRGGGPFQKTVRLKREGIYRLQLVAKGGKGGYVVWSRIALKTRPPKVVAPLPRPVSPLPKKPDIVLYVIDSLRADRLGCYGYGRQTTPSIDKFARENALYRNAYSNSAWTKPAAASLFTGLFPKNHLTQHLTDRLPKGAVTLAEELGKNGYRTAAIVGNDILDSRFKIGRGFEAFQVQALSSEINQEVFRFLDSVLPRKDREPLFLLIWAMDPHAPYTPDPAFRNLFDIRRYEPIDALEKSELIMRIRSGRIRPTPGQWEYMKTLYDQEVAFSDASFGRLRVYMEDKGVYRDAVVIVTADHGEAFNEHGAVGHGSSLHNELIRVPLIIKAPPLSKGAHEERVQHTDLFPTLLDLLGLEPPYPLDGASLLRLTDPKRTLFFDLATYNSTAVLDEKKIIFTGAKHAALTGVPSLEVYALTDPDEEHPLELESFRDQISLQKLLFHRNTPGQFGSQGRAAKITKEMEEKLKALGYIN